MNVQSRYPSNAWRKSRAGISGLFGIVAAAVLLTPGKSDAISAWSAKYKVNCRTCHTPAFARLNLYGDRFVLNGYQDPDNDSADGSKVGKSSLGENLSLDKNVRNWLMARLSVTPLDVIANGKVIDKKDTVAKVSIGNSNWLQLFVAGSIAKNVSIYIESEFAPKEFHIAWYYLGFHNLFGTSMVNFHVGRVSPNLFAPHPDRLPQLPGLVGKPGVMRVKTADGKGGASVDLRSPRYGVQYYGYTGPIVLFSGVTSGGTPDYPGPLSGLGYWAGTKMYLPNAKEGVMGKLEGSSIGYTYYGGKDIKGPDTRTEDAYSRHMPGVNVRWDDKVDIHASYVIGTDDNWKLDTLASAKKEVNFQGVRAQGSYHFNDFWTVGGQWDNYWSDNSSLLPEEKMLFFPVITFYPRENIRISAYPGYDFRDVDDNFKKHEFLTNIRIGF